MRKEIPKIATIFLITVGVVVWGLNYIFLGQAPKSKAAGETISFVFDPASVSQTSGDFVTSIKIKPSVDMTIRGYQFEIPFDKSKIQFKSIQYKTGAVSAGVGDDDSKTSVINQNGKIKVVGEIQSATGQVILASQNTEIVEITFTANSAQSSSITTGATDAKFFMIKPDYSLFEVPSAGQASFSVNGGTPTNTPVPTATTAPGQPTNTPVPNPTGTVTLSLSLKFQGIQSQPVGDLNKLDIKVFLAGGGLTEPKLADRTDTFTAGAKGIWSGAADFTGVLPGEGYYVLVKGPYHLQKKICDAVPTESVPGTYQCSQGKISLQSGKTVLDFSGIYLLAGDLPVQDGSITAGDTSFIYNNLGKNNDKCDVNRDGICDTQDFSLVIGALSVKNDEL